MPVLAGEFMWWAGASTLAFFGFKTASKGEEAISDITKAVPWVVGGLAVYLLIKGK